MNLVRAGQSNILSCFVFHHTSKRIEPGCWGDPACQTWAWKNDFYTEHWRYFCLSTYIEWGSFNASMLWKVFMSIPYSKLAHQIRQKLRVWEHPRSSNQITCGYKLWNCLEWVSQCLNRVAGPERMGREEETAAWLLSHHLSVSNRLNSVKHCDIFRWGESLQRVKI